MSTIAMVLKGFTKATIGVIAMLVLALVAANAGEAAIFAIIGVALMVPVTVSYAVYASRDLKKVVEPLLA